MPKPVPPPPPQPSIEETRAAVRLVGLLSGIALALYLLWTIPYGLDNPIVHYGRDNSTSWNLWKLDRLVRSPKRMAALRAHDGGRVAWLVGSSILRESFDEDAVNAGLEANGSQWRVAKFGQDAGASGVSWGMVKRLPLREGDRIVHSVAMENFQTNWIAFSKLPPRRIAMMLDLAEIWQVEEWSTQDKLEISAGFPRAFWSYRDEFMDGLSGWLLAPIEGTPRWRKRSYHIQFHKKLETGKRLYITREEGEAAWVYLSEDEIDLSPDQFNVVGLERMRRRCEALGVELMLIDIPPRQEYRHTMMEPAVREAWDAWRAEQDDLYYFPQLPEDDLYDMKHPNFRGRATLTEHLIGWLDDPVRGAPSRTRWPLPGAGGAEDEVDDGDTGAGAAP